MRFKVKKIKSKKQNTYKHYVMVDNTKNKD